MSTLITTPRDSEAQRHPVHLTTYYTLNTMRLSSPLVLPYRHLGLQLNGSLHQAGVLCVICFRERNIILDSTEPMINGGHKRTTVTHHTLFADHEAQLELEEPVVLLNRLEIATSKLQHDSYVAWGKYWKGRA